jgi:magnesium transporter
MVFNLATAILAAFVVGLFERTLSQVIALATFMPIVAGMGGNGAIQTITVMVRGIALGELEFYATWRVIVKEVAVNVTIAVITGILVAGVAYGWKGNPYLGFVLALAMIVNLGVVAALSGTLIPLTLKGLKFDPAIGSGVVVTTFTDCFGFFSFLGLATVFLDYLM